MYVLLASIGGLFYGSWLFSNGLTAAKRKDKMMITPTSKIRSLAVGRAEVFGVAEAGPGGEVTSPSGIKCVLWKTEDRLEGFMQSVKRNSPNAFYVRDDTGRVIVIPSFPKIDLRRYIPSTLPNGKRKEWFLKHGDRVYVIGTATQNQMFGGALPENEVGLVITGENSRECYISDRPERDVLRHHTASVFWGIYGGGALMLASAMVILLILGIL
jgi:hypothetical protein